MNAINNSSIKGISKDLNINPDMLAKFLKNNPDLKSQSAKGNIKQQMDKVTTPDERRQPKYCAIMI
jgi:hypothetical protein